MCTTINATKSKLSAELETIMSLSEYFWLGKESKFATILKVSPEHRSIAVLDDAGVMRAINLHHMENWLSTNMAAIPRSAAGNVIDLKSSLFRLLTLTYDLEVAETAISALKAAGYKHAQADKPTKALYNFYKGNTALNKTSQEAFNKIIGAGRFKPNTYEEFKNAYIEGFEDGLASKKEAKEAKKMANRHCVDAIANSYSGDIDVLIAWLQKWASGIVIRAAGEIDYEESDGCAKARANSRASLEATLEELEAENKIIEGYQPEYSNGIFNGWELLLKRGHRADMPKEVLTWVYDKKNSTDMESYELGNVYREDRNMINGNPIIKDLVFNYGFKVGRYR